MSVYGVATYGSSVFGPAIPGLCWVELATRSAVAVSLLPKSRLEVTVMPLSALQSNVLVFTLRFEQAGAYADPNSVSLRLKKPDGTELSPAPVPSRTALGTWRWEFDTAGQPAGTWTYRAEGDGLVDAATEGTFSLTQSAFS